MSTDGEPAEAPADSTRQTAQCRCRWCKLAPWALPTAAAVLVVLTLALAAGGRYPWPVDAAVYLATATMVYAVLSGPVMRQRWRHEDRLFNEQDR
ncbi:MULTISPECIES: hypothetical protein [Terrabacteria group]|uniref:hypothetical protein n=1 Tax=Bacillati TaxID=1783272 RepID=UPI0035E1BBD6